MAIIRKHIDNVFSQKYSLLDHKMLEKYFTDEGLSQETKLVVKKQWEQFDPGLGTPPNLDHVYHKLYYNIYQNANNTVSKGSNLVIKLLRIAAVLIIGVLSTTSIYFYNNADRRSSNQPVEIISHSGFRNQFKLPDGTSGWLGYDSKLIYNIDSEGRRIINLDGLAFFDVEHKKEQPFIVKTPAKVGVEVIGTSFNVSSYSEDNSCDIVLERGSVKLNLPNKKIQNMVPNDRIIYHSFDNSLIKSKVDVNDFLAWKDGELILKNVSLSEACMKLSRFYNVEFDLETTRQNYQRIRMTLKDDPLEDALKLLTIVSSVTYRVEERKVLSDGNFTKKKIIIKDK